MNENDSNTTSLQKITVQKDRLIEAIKENRAIHKEIFDAAVEGFWSSCEKKLKDKSVEAREKTEGMILNFEAQESKFLKAIEKRDRNSLTIFENKAVCTGIAPEWRPSFPVQHLDDYDRTIQMLNFSVAEKVELSVKEFDSYVRNNWSWREEFETTSLDLVRSVTGAYFSSGTLSNNLFGYAISGTSHSASL